MSRTRRSGSIAGSEGAQSQKKNVILSDSGNPRGWRTARLCRRSWRAADISYSTHKSKWNDQQRIRARILFTKFPDLEMAYGLFLKLVDIFNEKTSAGVARLKLARWYNEVEAFGNNEFNKVLETFENHNTTIINYFERRLTNASAESFNAKIKAFRTQFRGVGDIRFFMFRLATLYS